MTYLLKELDHLGLLALGAVVLDGDYHRVVGKIEGVVLGRGEGEGRGRGRGRGRIEQYNITEDVHASKYFLLRNLLCMFFSCIHSL